MDLKTVTVAGVPEHFNAPWKYAIQENLFEPAGIKLEFIEYSTGTGAMCGDLSADKLDMAVVLTDGIKHYQQQDPSLKIISTYVETPLLWGIHVANSAIHSTADLKDKTFAISRFGSGSHTMVQLLAKKHGWDFSSIKFLEVGDIHHLGSALLNNKADAFLWEVFTTKPYLEQYHLRLLDTLPTPWPCFQIVATATMAAQTSLVERICQSIFSVCKQFNNDPNFAAENIKKFYDLKLADIQAWLKTVRWAEDFD